MNAKTLSGTVLVLALTVAGARAQEGLGVGIIAGEPTGISIKKWIAPERAIDGAAAWSFSENDSFQVHADYLLHHFGSLKTDPAAGRAPVYYGVGGRVRLRDDSGRGNKDDDVAVGVRIPLGITYLFTEAPMDFFIEIVPILDVVPDTDLELNAAIGLRYYFR